MKLKGRSLYGNLFMESNTDTTIPVEEVQKVINPDEGEALKPNAKASSIWFWVAIIGMFIVLMQITGNKVV